MNYADLAEQQKNKPKEEASIPWFLYPSISLLLLVATLIIVLVVLMFAYVTDIGGCI